MHRGCFVWTPTPPLSGRRTPRLGPVCVCVCVLSWPGRAGGPPGRALVRLTFSCGRSCCSLCPLGPLRAGDALLVLFLGFSFPPLSCAPLVSGVPCFPAVGALGLGVLWSFPSLSFVSLVFFSSLPPGWLFVFGFFLPVFLPLLFFFSCCAGCAVPGWCVVGSGACWCVLLWALCFGGGRCARALCCSVPLACAFPFCFASCCVVCARWRSAGGVALPLAASGGCRVVLPAGPLRFFFCVGFVLVVPLRRLVMLSCLVVCRASCGVVLRSVVCFLLCPLLCGVLVFLRRVVLGRVVLLLWCVAFVRCCVLCLVFFFCCSLPFRGAPGCVCFCALLVRCCAGVPASLLSVRCSPASEALADVLCCCLLCLRVGCWVWLSSVVSWWVLLAPGVVFRWCAVVCPWVPCCAVLLRVVPPGVVWFRFALFGAVVWCVLSLSVVLGTCGFGRCVLSCLAALCVFCCGVSLRGVVRRRALRRVRPGVSCSAFPVLSSLCGVAVGPCSPLMPCSPVLCPVVLCCRVVLWCPVLLLCLVCFLPLFRFSYLKNRCKIC